MFIPLPFTISDGLLCRLLWQLALALLCPSPCLPPTSLGTRQQVHGKGIPLGIPPWSLVHPSNFGTLWLWRSLLLLNTTNSPPCGLLANPSTTCSPSTSSLWGLGNWHPPA